MSSKKKGVNSHELAGVYIDDLAGTSASIQYLNIIELMCLYIYICEYFPHERQKAIKNFWGLEIQGVITIYFIF